RNAAFCAGGRASGLRRRNRSEISKIRFRPHFAELLISKNSPISAAKTHGVPPTATPDCGANPGAKLMIERFVAAICGALVFVGCSSAVMAQSGIDSVYGYAGERTASGARAKPSGFPAAPRTLPFGTRVRVTNNSNGRSVMVRINDRGPFVRGRVIDLTPAAASALGFNGLARVTLQAS